MIVNLTNGEIQVAIIALGEYHDKLEEQEKTDECDLPEGNLELIAKLKNTEYALNVLTSAL